MSELKKKKVEISSLLIMIERIFSRPKSRTDKTFFKVVANLILLKNCP